MAQHGDGFRREDCIWINDKLDIVGKLERIDDETKKIESIREGIERINGTIARHENQIGINTIALAILKDHDNRGVSVKQALLTAFLALGGGALLLLFKALI